MKIYAFLAVAALAASAFGADLNGSLIDACKADKLDTINALLAQGADLRALDSHGYNCFMWAVGRAGAATVQALLDRGVELKPKEAPGFIALIEAAKNGNAAAVPVLIARGAKVDERDEHGMSAFLYAAVGGSQDAAQALLDKGADKNAKDNNGFTALIRASKLSPTAPLLFLLSKNVDLNVQDPRFGYSALMWAAQVGNSAAVRLLLDKGANAALKSLAGLTAADIAKKRGYPDIAAAILSRA